MSKEYEGTIYKADAIDALFNRAHENLPSVDAGGSIHYSLDCYDAMAVIKAISPIDFNRELAVYRCYAEKLEHLCNVYGPTNTVKSQLQTLWVLANKEVSDSANQPTSGHWLFTADGIRCSQCNHKLETTAIPQRCPNCGSELTPSMYTY